MTLSILVLSLVFTINLVLLLFVLTKKNNLAKRPFIWLLILIISWQATELLNILFFVDYPILLLLGVRMGLLPALFIPPVFLWLSLSLFNGWTPLINWKKVIIFLPAIIMSPFVFTHHNLDNAVAIEGYIFYEPGQLYWFFAVYFVLLMSAGLYALIKNRRQAPVIVKRQLDYIFIATAIVAIFALLFNIILPLLGSGNLYYVGVNSTIFFTIILSYALFKYRFFDLKITVYQALIDLLRLFITTIIFYLLYLCLDRSVGLDFSAPQNLVNWLAFVGLTAPFLFRLINKIVVASLINPLNDIKNAEDKIADILRSSRDLNILFSRLSREISKVIDYKEIYFYLSKKSSTQVFYQVFPAGERILNASDSQLLQFLKLKRQIANTAEIAYLRNNLPLIRELEEKQIDIAVPIFYNRQLLGMVMIDNDNKFLSIQQLHFLNRVNKYLDIAIGSLLLHQQDMADRQ